MRYAVIGGFAWCLTYYFFAFMLCFMARMMSWKLLHPNIRRCKFFCLIDAKDHEKKNKRWRNCKVFTMTACVVLFIAFVCIGIGLLYTGDDAAGFCIFIGLIFISYYWTNIFMSCKPMGLIALWTDTIPPPGKNFFAHLQVSAKLDQYANKISINTYAGADSPIVRVGTNLEVEMTENSPKNGAKQQKEKPKSRQKHTLSREDIETMSVRTGVSPYMPGLNAPGNIEPTTSKMEFAEERVRALINRYRKFRYVYKEPEKQLKKKVGEDANIAAFCGCRRNYWQIRLFWNNYKNYWLNVYRPFDEYDMETNLTSTNILKGFQWVKPCIECACFKKKSTKGKCGRLCAYVMDNTCNICLILFFAGLIGTLLYFASIYGITPETGVETVSVTESSSTFQYYPVCAETFGAQSNENTTAEEKARIEEAELSVLDALFLTQIVYEQDNFKLDEMIEGYFGNDTYDIISTQYEVPYYFHIKHKYVDVDYLSIRGTASLAEALQDISLFVEVALLELLQNIVPFLNALPQSFIAYIIYYSSLTEELINADVRDQFDEPIYNYLDNYLSDATTSMHIMGHSLGGGIASIVAANLYETGFDSSVSSFGVCSPGILYSSAKFGFGIEALDKTCRSLLPRRDLVSKIDEHGGTIQYTDCKDESMLNCHKTPSVICEVYNNCPNSLARRPEIFECFCNKPSDQQQFGYCLEATECQDEECDINL